MKIERKVDLSEEDGADSAERFLLKISKADICSILMNGNKLFEICQ